QKFPTKNCILTDLPEVTNLIKFKPSNLTVLNENFFNPFSFKADAIILSRILHDWNDNKAKIILKNCYNALNQNGKLFVIEIIQNEISANLLSLNMMLMTESFERTFKEYNSLLKKNNFEIKSKIKLNELQTILISIKK
ncbi:MAG: methyltransferase, partial [Bacteroidota bacterium]|nr:methyltransferase [Bacteroidota bacterium]